MTADPEAMWAGFYAGLTWQPIAEYDRRAGRVVLLRSNGDEAIGFSQDAIWRHAQESLEGQPLDFAPRQFAEVSAEWRVHLMAD